MDAVRSNESRLLFRAELMCAESELWIEFVPDHAVRAFAFVHEARFLGDSFFGCLLLAFSRFSDIWLSRSFPVFCGRNIYLARKMIKKYVPFALCGL